MSSVVQRDLSARSVEDTAAIGFADGMSMSASSAAVKARLWRELFCTIPIFHFKVRIDFSLCFFLRQTKMRHDQVQNCLNRTVL